jgi:hypothetical protein
MSLNHSDIIIIRDDDNLPPQKKKGVVSISKQHASNASAKLCPGYQHHFPLNQQAHTSYPFALHIMLLLPWDYSMHHNGFFLISHLCTSLIERNGRCKWCDGLRSNEHLQKIDARFRNGVYENANLMYYRMGGLVNIVYWKMQTINLLCLHCLNDLKKLIGKEGTIDMHKQILLAISSQQIPYISYILHVGFWCGASIHIMLKLVKKAMERTYHLKGYDEEKDL